MRPAQIGSDLRLIFLWSQVSRGRPESRASQVGLHKHKKDTASAKEGIVSLLRRGGQRLIDKAML